LASYGLPPLIELQFHWIDFFANPGVGGEGARLHDP
jgi:hypothetical protein